MNEKILVVDDEKEICMILIVLSACCFDEQKNETSK